MLSQRVKAALIFVPLVLILIYIGGWVFNLFIAVVLLLAAYEFIQLFKRIGYRPSFLTASAGMLLIVFQRWFFGEKYSGVFLTLLLTMVIIVALIAYERGEKDPSFNMAIHLVVGFYLGWVGSFFILLRAMPEGLGWLLTALPAAWLADAGAYTIGRWLGKRKMTPRLSPGKTWAGLLGGIITGSLSGLLLLLLWRSVGFLAVDTPLWQGLVAGIVVSCLSPLGDLFISLIKRTANVKDTGNLIPGHGGVLDRIDTWIWAGMLGYYLILLFNR
ncbi:MAG: phosphatidate cytidylyltransferase [Brevefilum sp.]|nr:phosphatidate cytidylyltransferase [Brevefilum sp.]